jgi:hypothetical protein
MRIDSTSEVFMHIATANFYSLSVTGPGMSAELSIPKAESAINGKAAVAKRIKQALNAII